MPRSSRSIIPGFFYHLTHRGNNKQRLFFTQRDYRGYLFCLESAAVKYRTKILAYCVMPNHVHLVASAEDRTSFARTINSAHLKYAQHFHRMRGTVGHVWQGRYYSCLLQQDHLIAAVRYVERNPARASIVTSAWDWVWSSAREHIKGERGIVTLIDAQEHMDIRSWKSFIALEEDEKYLNEIRQQTNSCLAMGSEDFKRHVHSAYGIKLLKNPPGRPKLEVSTADVKIRDVFGF